MNPEQDEGGSNVIRSYLSTIALLRSEQSRLRHQLKAFQEGRADPYGEDPAANYDLDDNALDFEEEHEDLEDEEEPLEIDEDLENDELHAELATVERTLQAKEARMRACRPRLRSCRTKSTRPMARVTAHPPGQPRATGSGGTQGKVRQAAEVARV